MTHSGWKISYLQCEEHICLNPSFAGWPTLGEFSSYWRRDWIFVLIPLLLDDPLWERRMTPFRMPFSCLNPSFAGWPTLGDSLYLDSTERGLSLNPSFAGWPTLGLCFYSANISFWYCLNPSFAGWPTLGSIKIFYQNIFELVLIPLLLDDPLWVLLHSI